MSAIGHVSCDDYEGLYIDGVLVESSSSLDTGHVVRALIGKTIDSYESVYVGDAFEDTGDLPRLFKDAKKHVVRS